MRLAHRSPSETERAAMTDLRTETDSLGRKQLPREAVWGIHIARALENFPITGVPLAHFPELVQAFAMVKKAAALANRDLGALDPAIAAAIATVMTDLSAIWGCSSRYVAVVLQRVTRAQRHR